MTKSASGCVGCDWIAGTRSPPGGTLLDTGGFRVHGFDGPTALPGWAVVTSRRHVRAVDALDGQELAELGPLLARVMRAQKAALGAEHGYVFAIGDALHHCHVHVVPRFADTPKRLWGRGAFDAAAEDFVPDARAAAALHALRAAL